MAKIWVKVITVHGYTYLAYLVIFCFSAISLFGYMGWKMINVSFKGVVKGSLALLYYMEWSYKESEVSPSSETFYPPPSSIISVL